MSRSNIPDEPHALLGYSRLVETTSRTNQPPDKWNLDGKRIADLKVVNDRLDAALKANDAKESKTHFTVIAKDEAVSATRVVLRGFINYLVGNVDKTTDADLKQLDIPPRHKIKHEPLPPPADMPVVVVSTGHNHDADLYFFDNQAGHPTTYLANKNYHAVQLKYQLQGETEWHQEMVTRKHLTLHFGNEASGKLLTVTAAWLNPRLETGPWSKEESAIIT